MSVAERQIPTGEQTTAWPTVSVNKGKTEVHSENFPNGSALNAVNAKY